MEGKTFKEQIDALKKDFKEFFNTSTSKFMDFKLADGTIVRCDTETLAKGSKLDVIDEKGNMLPLPDGEWDMNGQKFTVEAGYVKDMAAAAAPAATQKAAQDAPATDAPDMAKVMDMMKAMQAQIDELKSKLGGAAPAEEMAKTSEAVNATVTRMSAVEKENGELKEAFKKMFDLVGEIANQTPDPTSKPQGFEKRTKDISADAVEEFRKNYLKSNL